MAKARVCKTLEETPSLVRIQSLPYSQLAQRQSTELLTPGSRYRNSHWELLCVSGVMVAQWSPKPLGVGSNPTGRVYSKKLWGGSIIG